MVPDPESGRDVEIRSSEHLGKILAKHQPDQQVRAQGPDDPNLESIAQLINPDSVNTFSILEVGADIPDFRNELFNSLSSNMGGAILFHAGSPFDDEEGELENETFSARTTWLYSQYEGEGSNGKIGVVVNEVGGASSAPIVNGGSGEIEVVAEWTQTELPAEAGVQPEVASTVTISVEGVEVYSITVQRPLPFSVSFLPVHPVFESPESGTYLITAEDIFSQPSSGENFTGSYFTQKGLALADDPVEEYTLNPGDPAVISNSFAWDFGDDPTALQQASWDVKITNPAGTQVAMVSGTGRNIAANVDTGALGAVGPFRLKPKGRDAPDGGTPIYGYEIVIRALAYDTSLPSFEIDPVPRPPAPADVVVFYEVSSAVSPTELKIINTELTPNPPFQNEGDSVELTAEVLAVGLGELTDDDIEWWVNLIGPDGEPVGDPLATGNGFEVSATWDGTVEGQAVDDPTAYNLRVQATTVCADLNPQRADVRAREACLVAIANLKLIGPHMAVAAMVVGESGLPGGIFEEAKVVGLGLPPALLPRNIDSVQKRRKYLGDVQKIARSPSDGYDVDIEVEVLFGQGVDPPDRLILQARHMLSGVVREGILAPRMSRNSVSNSAVYQVEGVNLPRDFIDADPANANNPNPYSIGEFSRDKALVVGPGLIAIGKKGSTGVSGGATEAFMDLVAVLFPDNDVFLGRFAETAILAHARSDLYPDLSTGPAVAPVSIPPVTVADQSALEIINTVTSNPDNLRALGFVAIEFTIQATDTDTDNRNPSALTPVYVKVPRVPQPAAPGQRAAPSNRGPGTVLFTFHGDHHDTGALSPSSDIDRFLAQGGQDWSLNPGDLRFRAEQDPRLKTTPDPRLLNQLAPVQLLIMTGCSVLDINDYNNGFAQPSVDTNGQAVWPGVNERTYGGEIWDRAMNIVNKSANAEAPGNPVILGYNNVAPLVDARNGVAVNNLAELMELYETELTTLTGIDESQRHQLAWMAANVKLADRSTGFFDARWFGLHAAAIDADYYYYIPQNKDRAIPPVSVNGVFVAYATEYVSVRKTSPVYRIPRIAVPVGTSPPTPGSAPPPMPEWGVLAPDPGSTTDLGSWETNRRLFAEPVSIPGLTYSKGGL